MEQKHQVQYTIKRNNGGKPKYFQTKQRLLMKRIYHRIFWPALMTYIKDTPIPMATR